MYLFKSDYVKSLKNLVDRYKNKVEALEKCLGEYDTGLLEGKIESLSEVIGNLEDILNGIIITPNKPKEDNENERE